MAMLNAPSDNVLIADRALKTPHPKPGFCVVSRAAQTIQEKDSRGATEHTEHAERLLMSPSVCSVCSVASSSTKSS
jgi:hypothetical protein